MVEKNNIKKPGLSAQALLTTGNYLLLIISPRPLVTNMPPVILLINLLILDVLNTLAK